MAGMKYHELLEAITGKGDVVEPAAEHHEEAQRLIDNPDIPKSDLRGVRDMQGYEGDNADAWDAK
jgi:hypothetical protein